MVGWLRELNAKERKTMWGCFGGWSLDAFDVQMYSFVIPTVISLWGLSRGEAHIVFPFLGVQLSQPPNHALAP